MYIPDDMVTIEAYMGPPADICPPPPTSYTSRRRNMSEDYSDSESSEESDDEVDGAKKPTASSSRDHADPYSKLAESNARTEATRRYLEESRQMHSIIPDFHRHSSSKRTQSVPANNNVKSSFNSSAFSSDCTSAEHKSRMSNLLTAMERTEQSRALLKRRTEAAASASTVSASGIMSLVMGRVGGPRKSRGASPPRSHQRLF